VNVVTSVTSRIRSIKQPRGGYLNKRYFNIIQREDNIELNEKENIPGNTVGTVVDYMTRFMMYSSKSEAFSISLIGAQAYDYFSEDGNATYKAETLLNGITGLNKESIINACKLVGYDVCYRAGIEWYKPIEEINPDIDTVENIITMINRSCSFWEEYGKIVKDGFTFEGGYTDLIHTGDGDFLTDDTLWDFKVIKTEPTSKNILQILVYYIMGRHSIHPEFKSIKKIGIFNPRLNKVYISEIDLIPSEVIKEVSEKVIGYK